MVLNVTAVPLGVSYLVRRQKGAHTDSTEDCPRLGIMQLRDVPRALGGGSVDVTAAVRLPLIASSTPYQNS
jgi:hypothetical protein